MIMFQKDLTTISLCIIRLIERDTEFETTQVRYSKWQYQVLAGDRHFRGWDHSFIIQFFGENKKICSEFFLPIGNGTVGNQ